MKRLVRSQRISAVAFGIVAGLIVIVVHASTGATYLITLAVGMIGFAFTRGPEGDSVWREIHRSRSASRRGRDGVA